MTVFRALLSLCTYLLWIAIVGLGISFLVSGGNSALMIVVTLKLGIVLGLLGAIIGLNALGNTAAVKNPHKQTMSKLVATYSGTGRYDTKHKMQDFYDAQERDNLR